MFDAQGHILMPRGTIRCDVEFLDISYTEEEKAFQMLSDNWFPAMAVLKKCSFVNSYESLTVKEVCFQPQCINILFWCPDKFIEQLSARAEPFV